MRNKYSAFLFIILFPLHIFAAAMEVPEHVRSFYVMRGKNITRLEESKFSVGGSVRWVEDLGMHWATKKNPTWGKDEEKRKVSEDSHDALSKLGAMLKIFRGFRTGSSDLTPESKNFLVPYVSFVIKHEDGSVEFIRGDYFRTKPDSPAVVFTSGEHPEEPEDLINAFMERDLPQISILAGRDRVNQGLRVALSDTESFFYKPEHRKALIQKATEYYTTLQGKATEEADKSSIKAIIFTLELLELIENKDYAGIIERRKDTLERLNSFLIKNKKAEFVIESDKDNPERAKDLQEAAWDRIDSEQEKLKILSPTEKSICDLLSVLGYKSARLNITNKWLEKLIQNIRLLPEYSFNGQTLQQHCSDLINPTWHDHSKDHTEFFLMGFVRAYPEIILDLLKNIKVKTPTAVSLKAVVLDVHSWADICKFCRLNFYKEWTKAVQRLQERVKALGFKLPKDEKIRSILRMSSEKQYQDHPHSHELIGAGGGFDIAKKGFEAKTIATKGIIIAQRRKITNTVLRDGVVASIPHQLLELCLYKPLDFWVKHPHIFSSFINIRQACTIDNLVLLAKVHPTHNIPFIMGALDVLQTIGLEDASNGKLAELAAMADTVISFEGELKEDDLSLLSFLHTGDRRSAYHRTHGIAYLKHYAQCFYGQINLELISRENKVGDSVFVNEMFKTFLSKGLVGSLKVEDKETIAKLKLALPKLKKKDKDVLWYTPEQYENNNISRAMELLG